MTFSTREVRVCLKLGDLYTETIPLPDILTGIKIPQFKIETF